MVALTGDEHMITRGEIVVGIGRGPWAAYWADLEEQKGASFSGVDLYEAAPRTPLWARDWAAEVATSIEVANGKSLVELYDIAVDCGYGFGAEHFGYHLGMQAVGHGVSWSDDCKYGNHDTIKIPYREFYE